LGRNDLVFLNSAAAKSQRHLSANSNRQILNGTVLHWLFYSTNRYTNYPVQLRGYKYEGIRINAFFDDVCFEMSVIPEPATIAMLTLAVC
jgi:hypothetical protein